MELLGKIFKGDRVIWGVFILLCVCSLIVIFSATSTIVYRQQNHWGPVMRHATFLFAGFGLIWFIHKINYKYFSSLVLLLLFSVFLLILTPILGQQTNDANRWISIMGISFQPSEFAKLSLIGTIALIFSRQNKDNEAYTLRWAMGITLLVCFFIFFDNLSTAVFLFVISVLLMIIAGAKWSLLFKYCGYLSLIAIVAVGVLMLIPKDSISPSGRLKRVGTWQARIQRFVDKKDKVKDASYYQITDDNYQEAYAKIAIAEAKGHGKLPGNSTVRDFLPQAYSDFIYAIILEETGLWGGFIVLALYLTLLIRCGIIAKKIDKLFPKYLILGCSLMIVFQALTNMAVAVGVFPVTGQPLPLISRGGTSTLVTCAYFGIILSISRIVTDKPKEDESVEVEDSDESLNLFTEKEEIDVAVE